MIPETPLNTATLSPEAESAEAVPTTAESATMDPAQVISTYADTLMAGLFGDLDRLLEGDEAALTAVEAELHAPPPIEDEPMPPPEPQTVTAPDLALAMPLASDLAPVAEAIPQPAPAPTKTTLGKLFDRFLLACTACSLAGVVLLLWQGQRPELAAPPSPDAAASAGQSDTEFLAYLQRSLDAIEQQVAEVEAAAQDAPALPNTALLPPVGLPSQGSPLGVPGRINVIERIYIPYQTTPPALPSTPPTTALVPPASSTSPALPTVPAPTPAAPTPTQPSVPVVNHVLVGVLELGDRSAALFDINGVSQRVYIGERIGNAGWTLVSVSNQEVVIRRNGEVRSIFIGQQF